MLPRTIDIYRVLPEMAWCCFGVLVMLMQPFVRSRHFFSFLAMIGTLAGKAASVTAGMDAGAGVCGGGGAGAVRFFFPLPGGTRPVLGGRAGGAALLRQQSPP